MKISNSSCSLEEARHKKSHILYESISMAFFQRQNCRTENRRVGAGAGVRGDYKGGIGSLRETGNCSLS